MKHVHPILSALGFCLIVCLSLNTTTAQAPAEQQRVKPEAKTNPPANQSESQPASQANTQPVNLLNGSMEYWHPSGLRAQGWGVWTSDPDKGTWSVHRNHKLVRDGQSSMQVNITTWANAFSGAKVQAGKTYTFSIYVRCDKPVQLTLTQHIGGKDVAGPERAAKRAKGVYDIKPNQWQRVAVTDTMPPGATSVTTYLLLRGQGQWIFDQGMLNEGQLIDYVPGDHYQPIAPLGRPKQAGETAFAPAFWNAASQEVDDQEIDFCFDADIMSLYRLRENGAAIGGHFEQPTRLRGLTLLLNETPLPNDVKLTLQIKRNDQWQDYDFKLLPVGTSLLMAFEPIEMQGIRVRFDFVEPPDDKHETSAEKPASKNSAKEKGAPRKLLLIYHISLAQ